MAQYETFFPQECEHAVQFYDNSETLCRTVVRFVGDGMRNRQPAIIIATPDHRLAIDDRLERVGFDVPMLCRTGNLVVLDAQATLDTFMVNGTPDAACFRDTVGTMIAQILSGRTELGVRAYGEMVNLLWNEGNAAGAIELEVLWNELAQTHRFSLLCGYALGQFYKETGGSKETGGFGMADVCRHHTRVTTA